MTWLDYFVVTSLIWVPALIGLAMHIIDRRVSR